jgi:hypothetical protein
MGSASGCASGRRHHGNAGVVRQEVIAEHGIAVSLRTVERAVAGYRQELAAEARATVRFETPPGKQMQIDFGERLVQIGGAEIRAYLFVAALGYSRRRSFASWEAFEARLEAWSRDIADARILGTTGEAPAARFARDEAVKLKSIDGIPPFRAAGELSRIVHGDCSVEVDANAYSVPWRLVGERVRVTVTAENVHIFHGAREVAVHAVCEGRLQRIVDAAHFDGLSGSERRSSGTTELPPRRTPSRPPLLRSLAEYEAHVGGGF